jgi:hypothetical protein
MSHGVREQIAQDIGARQPRAGTATRGRMMPSLPTFMDMIMCAKEPADERDD